MRKLRFILMLVLCGIAMKNSLLAQDIQQKVSLRDPLFLDTASVVFHEIYDFWQKYEYAQFLDYGRMSDPQYKPTSYDFWADFEIENYGNPNSIIQSNLLPFYAYEEYFMGDSRRIQVGQ